MAFPVICRIATFMPLQGGHSVGSRSAVIVKLATLGGYVK